MSLDKIIEHMKNSGATSDDIQREIDAYEEKIVHHTAQPVSHDDLSVSQDAIDAVQGGEPVEGTPDRASEISSNLSNPDTNTLQAEIETIKARLCILETNSKSLFEKIWG